MNDISFVLDGGLKGGGAERVALNLISFWVADGRKVRLITLTGPEEDFYVMPRGVERIVLGGVKPSASKLDGLVSNIKRVLRLRAVIKRQPSPVVISFLTIPNIKTILACLGLGKKVIVSERIDTSKEKQLCVWLFLRRVLYRFADVVTANSKVALDDMAKYVASSMLAFVPNPVVIPAKPATPDCSQKILTVGRIEAQKNQAFLVKAFAGMGERSCGWTLEVCGKGKKEHALRALIRELKLEKRVFLQGQVSDLDVHYQAAGIFVLPSIYEGTPNALLEAMAYGLPCVIPDNLPGALAHIENGITGVIFEHGNANDLENKIQMLIHDPFLRNKIGTAARERMRAYSPQHVAVIWDELGAL